MRNRAELRISAIVLAAGDGRRLGGGKLTLPYGSGTIINAVVDTVLQAGPMDILVVLGRYRDEVMEALRGAPVRFVVNAEPDLGMLSSVKRGLRNIPDDADGFLVVLGDQPDIQTSSIHALLDASVSGDGWMFIPEFDGKRGHPALFRREARESILALPNDSGLNAWREANRDRVTIVPVNTPEVLWDVDTPEDYRASRERSAR